jgi:hypothetical protein
VPEECHVLPQIASKQKASFGFLPSSGVVPSTNGKPLRRVCFGGNTPPESGQSQTIVKYASANTPLCLFYSLSLPLCTSGGNYAEISVRKKMHLAGRIPMR